MNATRHTLVNALRHAAALYGHDAERATETAPRIAEQFLRQEQECIALSDAIEQASTITLVD